VPAIDSDDPEFDLSKAELFEALGHHTRIRILQVLNEKPMGFSELKKSSGIESSGLMSFHLGKLTHLVRSTQEGTYALTDQGREAVRMVQITRGQENGQTIKVRSSGKRRYTAAIVVLLVCLLALVSFSVIQQQQISALNQREFGSTFPNTLVYGALASHGWVTGITTTSQTSAITFTSAAGRSYTAYPNALGQYWTMLPGGKNYTVTVSWKGVIACLPSCESIIRDSSDYTGISLGNATGPQCPQSGCVPTVCVHSGCFFEGSLNPKTMSASGNCGGTILELNSADTLNYDLSC